MNTDERRLNDITETIIGCAYKVSNELDSGFVEKVYENALAHELKKSGLQVEQQKPVQVYYDGIVVGEYVTDVIVMGSVLIELKAVKKFNDIHMAQCLNYLRATGLKICLLINFGTPRIGLKRIVNEL